jgi:hypothetical protein
LPGQSLISIGVGNARGTLTVRQAVSVFAPILRTASFSELVSYATTIGPSVQRPCRKVTWIDRQESPSVRTAIAVT